jgi:1-pyrroline-5-carboxylate dehydrogenase
LLTSLFQGEPFIKMPRTSVAELDRFVASLKRVPKSGLHNPFKNPERYVQWGEVSAKAAERLAQPEVAHHFALCIQRVMPKSYVEAMKASKLLGHVFEDPLTRDGRR